MSVPTSESEDRFVEVQRLLWVAIILGIVAIVCISSFIPEPIPRMWMSIQEGLGIGLLVMFMAKFLHRLKLVKQRRIANAKRPEAK